MHPPVGERAPMLLMAMEKFATSSLEPGVPARRQNRVAANPRFADMFAPAELVVIFLICSERERKALV